MNKIKDLIKFKYLPILYLIFVTLWLRFVNLGYSDFQGDEIKALFRPAANQTFWEFLFSQRKGPIQFLVTYLLKFFDPIYYNQLLLRLPFAIAGVLAVYFFYKFVTFHFGKKIALYASLFFSLNGLFVAFSRIVQYQSFTILFSILALYFFSLTLKAESWKFKGWYYGMVFWALSILSHYDGGFIAPFVAYIAYLWYINNPQLTTNKKFKNLLYPSLVFLILLSLFFVPYVFNISVDTKLYWTNRLSGGKEKISSSIVTFKLYNPKFVFYFLSTLVAASFLKFKKTWPVVLWALFPYVLWEFVTNVPGTHIYNYIIPATILAGIGIVVIENINIKIFKKRFGKVINTFGLTVMFLFMFALTHWVFVDHSVEYPWSVKKFYIWDLNKPNPIFHNSIFGFPYYRNWEGIWEFVSENNNGHYSTNERSSIPRFYIQIPKDTILAGPYISINNPQSFSGNFLQKKAIYWSERHEPDKVFTKAGKILAKVYIMQPGELHELQSQGY